MDLSSIIISIETTSVSIIIIFFLGIWLARVVVSMKSEHQKITLNGVLALSLIPPPTITGFFLLYLFGMKRPIDLLLNRLFSYKIMLTWQATVLATVVISLLLAYRPARSALEQVEEDLMHTARTLGLSKKIIFWKTVFPVVRPGTLSDGVVAFAGGLGEFGITAMIAGDTTEKTRTLPLAIYSEAAANNMTQTGKYVAVIVTVSFLIVVDMNYVEGNRARDIAENRTKDKIKAGVREQKETHGMSLTVDIQKKLEDITLNISFEIHEIGDIIGTLKASGYGKSIALRCITGIETPDRGRTMLNDRVPFDSEKKISRETQGRKVGHLFQHYALFPNITVQQNVGLALHGIKTGRLETASQCLELLRVDGPADNYPSRLSGGQQQWVALTRILASKPDVLMLDELFSALDYYLEESPQLELLEVLNMYQGDILTVTHNQDEIYHLCQNICILDQDQIVTSGGIKQVSKDPKAIAAAKLTGCKNIKTIEIISGRHLRVPAWDADIHLQKTILENIRAIDIRIHHFRLPEPDEAEDVLPHHCRQLLEDPFEATIITRNRV